MDFTFTELISSTRGGMYEYLDTSISDVYTFIVYLLSNVFNVLCVTMGENRSSGSGCFDVFFSC